MIIPEQIRDYHLGSPPDDNIPIHLESDERDLAKRLHNALLNCRKELDPATEQVVIDWIQKTDIQIILNIMWYLHDGWRRI